MKEKINSDYLIEIIKGLGINVFMDRILSPGGYCRLYNKKYIIISNKISEPYRLRILKEILKTLINENIYVEPRIRDFIENE